MAGLITQVAVSVTTAAVVRRFVLVSVDSAKIRAEQRLISWSGRRRR